MRTAAVNLKQLLDQLARDARPGDRLPSIRELMRRFGVSQAVVQQEFQSLQARGLTTSHVGRGTFFIGEEGRLAAPKAAQSPGVRVPTVRSVLLLRRSISIVRGRVVLEGLQRRFTGDGHRVLEVSYTDPGHARTVLKGLPRFDACVVQSTFNTITIDLLAALREKCDVLTVDGLALAGADVEAVGMEWGEPLTEALASLNDQGHRRMAYATTLHPFLASELGRRRFGQLRLASTGTEWYSIDVPHLPDGDYESRLVGMIQASLDASGRLPYTALVAWGVEDGAKFHALLTAAGIDVPSTLSVVLLGRTDLSNEHADFFDTVGCSTADQIELLHQAIEVRWANASIPYGVRLVPVTSRAGQSTGAPRRDRTEARSHKSARALV